MEPLPDLPQLEDLLSRPTDGLVETFRSFEGDFLFLGAGGKMGPSLSRMAARAARAAGIPGKIRAASRFTDPESRSGLEASGIETIACDLLDESAVARLPDAARVVFMTGMKFGGAQQAARMWAMNTLVPSMVCRRFPSSRWLVFSTGNVYPFTSVASGGPVEEDPLEPVGEYGMSALGRERIFEYFSRSLEMPVSIVRLNYACDLRYGVLVDLAQQVWSGQPVDLAMSYFNTIWQGDANAVALQSLGRAASPPFLLNVTGPERLSVREVCGRLGRLMKKPVVFAGTETPTALLSRTDKMAGLFGEPRVRVETLIEWVAQWVMNGRPVWGKPTHFQSRDGRF
jgi:nucleoside-diphosphate-sugar epimerase